MGSRRLDVAHIDQGSWLPWACYQIRYAKLRVAHAPGMPGTFSRHWFKRKPLVSDPGMHYGTCHIVYIIDVYQFSSVLPFYPGHYLTNELPLDGTVQSIDLLYNSHNAAVPYPTMHQFVAEHAYMIHVKVVAFFYKTQRHSDHSFIV